jgi:hypothetical protein
VTSCDDERCLLDGETVPLAGLAWIGLGVGDDLAPAGVQERGVVLADGTVRSGRFRGMSLGSVLLEAEEIERALVRWVRVAEVPPPVDVLVRRDGAVRTGALQGCAAGACTMSGVATTRGELVWIGLGVSPEAIVSPAAPQDGARDMAQFADGSSRVTPLVGVGANDVVLGAGAFPRAEIAWVYLAPPASEPADGPIYRPSPPSAPGFPQGPAPPSTPPSSEPPSDRTPPQPPAGSSGERGGLWTGTITARAFGHADEIYSDWNATIDVRLREYLSPLHCWKPGALRAPRVGTLIRLLPEGSIVTNSFRCSSPYVSCSGSGSVTVTVAEGESDITQPAAIYLKTSDVDTSECLGLDMPLGGGEYFLAVGTRSADTFPVTWVSSSGTSTEPSSFLSPVAGWSRLLPFTDCADHVVRTLEGGGGVMRGSYTGPCSGCCPTLTMSWSVCREGASCPPPPALPPADDEEEPPSDCDETRGDRAQLDLKMNQLKALLQSLKGAREEHLRMAQQAAQWEGDYEFAMRQCNLWSAARFLVGMLATGGGSALNPVLGRGTGFTGPVTELEATKQFWNFLGMIEKVNNGDPSWLLPNHEFKSAFGLSVEDAWDGFVIGYGQLGSSSPQALRQGLQDCAAANINAVMDGASQYLRLLEQIQPLADRMHKLVNDVGDKDEQIFDFCLSHSRACEDYERCR